MKKPLKKPSNPFSQLSPSLFKQYFLSFFIVLILCGVLWLQTELSTSFLPQAGEVTELYANQKDDNLTLLFTQAIDSAHESIILVVYSLTDSQIISHLIQKSKEGIKINIVCDAKASPGIRSKLGKNINLIRRFGPGLMHQKMLVIDQEKVWIGSANMTPESLEMHGNLVMAMDNQELAKLVSAKALAFKDEGKAAEYSHLDLTVGGQSMEMWFLPDDRNALKRLKNLIGAAKKTIQIAMFTWTRYDMAEAVIAASKRGVKVEVVIDHHSGKGTSAKVVQLLKENGIEVALGPSNTLLHHKFLYIDHSVLVNGSTNWTKAAFTKNDDCFIVLYQLTSTQQKNMNLLWDVIMQESRLP